MSTDCKAPKGIGESSSADHQFVIPSAGPSKSRKVALVVIHFKRESINKCIQELFDIVKLNIWTDLTACDNKWWLEVDASWCSCFQTDASDIRKKKLSLPASHVSVWIVTYIKRQAAISDQSTWFTREVNSRDLYSKPRTQSRPY